MTPPTPEAVRAALLEAATRQRVPVLVTDPSLLARVAAVIGPAPVPIRTRRKPAA